MSDSHYLKYSSRVDPQIEALMLDLSAKLGVSDLFLQTKNVKRFIRSDSPYPEGMISDNVYDHTCRCGYILSQIFEREDLEFSLSMILLHDILEIYGGDKSILEKSYEDELSERNLKSIIFKDNPYSLNIYDSFLKGDDFVNGGIWDYSDELRVPIIVKMVDRTEGNSYFHMRLFNWLSNGCEELPDSLSLRFMFENNQKILNGVSKESRGVPKELQLLSREILLLPERIVEELYDGKENLLPDEIHDYLIHV